MVNRDKQVAQFIDAINKNALKECKRIEKDTKKLYTGQADKLQRSAELLVKERVDYAKTEIETRFNKNVAQSYSRCRARVAERRAEITNEVFEKATKELVEFTKGEEYVDFLAKSLKAVFAFVNGKFTASVKPGDEKALLKAAEKAGIECDAKADTAIKIGGIKVECLALGKIFDDTLDSRLEDQKEWFFANSGFTISE